MSQYLKSKNQQKKESARASLDTTAGLDSNLMSQVVASVLPPAPAVAPTVTTSGTPDFMTKLKLFFTKPISAGSKIQYWHIALGLVVAFVLYVEMVADRKTQRKLKFW